MNLKWRNLLVMALSVAAFSSAAEAQRCQKRLVVQTLKKVNGEVRVPFKRACDPQAYDEKMIALGELDRQLEKHFYECPDQGARINAAADKIQFYFQGMLERRAQCGE